jgi:retron-type reverse transcriptase
LQAYTQAARGKRGGGAVAAFEHRLEDNLFALRAELGDGSYRPGGYTSFFIHEPKRRLISAAPFRDRVVHHALCNVIVPVFERGFIDDSYANRLGKGTHRANDRCQQYARRFRYALQCDVEQFFPAIDHAILRAQLARRVRDPRILNLIDLILKSGEGVLSGAYDMRYFAGDTLFEALRPRGLPIGNLTSQFWANCYLDPLDQFVKRGLGCRGYVRYVDDFVLFADDPSTLWRWRDAIEDRLAALRLTIHPGAHPRPVTEGIPFLGFIVFPDHRRLKRRKAVHFARKFKKLIAGYQAGSYGLDAVTASARGWANHARYGNTTALRESVFARNPLPRMEK